MDWKETNARQRQVIVAGAALAINVLLLAAVAGLFHSASRMPWLTPGEDNAALLARCQRIQGTSARHTCVESVVAAVQQHSAGQRLAAATGRPAGPAAASAVGR
jgi:hypothetical protein